jgi:MoaA/NifB/PqqE/SkfB family radical SAM enzyme
LVTASSGFALSHGWKIPQINTTDFDGRLFIAIGEVTDEGKRLIAQITALKVPVFVLTGGDPIKRPGPFELIAHARSVGVRVLLTPSATPLLTKDVMSDSKEAGLARLAVSIDGASAKTHDAFPFQINTTFSRRNIGESDSIVGLMEKLNITLWSVLFLVSTGRGKLNDLLSAEEFESAFAKVCSFRRQRASTLRRLKRNITGSIFCSSGSLNASWE